MKHIIALIFILLFILFSLFLSIVHIMRRREMPDEFNWKMDYGAIDIVDTLRWFFVKLKDRRKKKKQQNP